MWEIVTEVWVGLALGWGNVEDWTYVNLVFVERA